MNLAEKLSRLAEVTSTQWGMITTAQAKTLGVSRVDLARMADAGHLERLAHGVYRASGIPDDRWSELRAAWLSTSPKLLAEARDRRGGDVTVAGESAALLNGIGDHRAHRHEFVAPQRRQTQRSDIRYRQRELDPVDVTLAEGLPVMTMERTIADLLESNIDFSLVADTLRDAVSRRHLDQERLMALLAPLAARNGLPTGDAQGLYDKLAETAQIDAAEAGEMIRRMSTRPALQEELKSGLAGYASTLLAEQRALLLEAIRPVLIERVLLGETLQLAGLGDLLGETPQLGLGDLLGETPQYLLGETLQLGLGDLLGKTPQLGLLGPELIPHDNDPRSMTGPASESETTGDE